MPSPTSPRVRAAKSCSHRGVSRATAITRTIDRSSSESSVRGEVPSRSEPGSSRTMAANAATTDVSRKAGGGVLAAACISALVVNANTSAVTILLPAISEDTGSSVAQLQWAVTGYMLVGAALIVTSGALGDVLGRRRVFMAGLLALHRLVCADRAFRQRHGRDHRTHDSGRCGLDDSRLRHEPPVSCGFGCSADEGDHALGSSVRRRRRARSTAQAASSSSSRAGRGCSGSTPQLPRPACRSRTSP